MMGRCGGQHPNATFTLIIRVQKCKDFYVKSLKINKRTMF